MISFLVLPFLFLLSPDAIPLSTSKPQKPMNKTKYKTQNKSNPLSTLHSNMFFSSTGAAVRNHAHIKSNPISIAWSFRRLGLVRIGAWVASLLLLWFIGFCIVASFFFNVDLWVLIFGCWSLGFAGMLCHY